MHYRILDKTRKRGILCERERNKEVGIHNNNKKIGWCADVPKEKLAEFFKL